MNNFNNQNNMFGFNRNIQTTNNSVKPKRNSSNNQSFEGASNAINSSNPKLKSIDPIKLKIINEIKEQCKSKSINQMLPEIMKVNQLLNAKNMSFSPEETALLFEVMEENMTQDEKQKFNAIKSFM